RIVRIGGRITSCPPEDGPCLEKWLGEVAATLARGEVVCLAGPHIPLLLQADSPARQRLEEILASTAAPVVELTLSGTRDGFLRIAQGRLAWNPRGHWPCTVHARFAAPRLARANAFESASGG